MTRRRFTGEEKQRFLIDWQTGGLSAGAFAKKNGISPACLWRWERKDPKQNLVFKPVEVVDEPVEDLVNLSSDNFAELTVGPCTARLCRGAQKNDIKALLSAMKEIFTC